MSMIRVSFFAAAALLAFAGAAAPSQTVRQITPAAPKAPKQITPRQAATPFPPDAWAPVSSSKVELRPAGQMTAQDRALEASAEAAIAEHAATSGMEFTSGHWSYEQIVCPAFPNHLFLRFTKNQGAGDVSVFSASIPRTGAGRVRVIAVQRRGYSLFSPAPVNAMTVGAFNQIRAEEQTMQAGGWADVGLCYAALAGANPQLPRPDDLAWKDEWTGEPRAYPQSSAEIEYPETGGAILRITDVSARAKSLKTKSAETRPVEWTLDFDAKGKLLKAARRPAAMIVATETHPQPVPPEAQPAQ